MTFEEKEKKILENRGTSLLGYSGALNSEANMKDERDLNDTFLFGDGVDIGIVNILELYYKELNISIGRTTSSPAMQNGIGSSQSAWKARFKSAVSKSGDGSLYLDVDPEDGIGDQDINENSVWFTTNDDNGETEGGIVADLIDGSDIKVAIGEAASQNANGRGSFTTNSEAEAHRDETKGTAILGKRTENSEIYSETTVYYVGENGIDNPHWYNTPEKTNFESAMQSIISSLNTYKSHIDTIEENLQTIADGNNDLFETSNMSGDAPTNDISKIQTLKSNVQTHIDNLQAELNYFSSFTASNDISSQTGYNKTTFDNKLTTTVPNILNNIKTTLQGRETDVNSAISYNNTTSGIRKWLVFWVKENILKPDAPYVGLDGIANALSQAEAGIKKANESLITLYGSDTGKWIARPNNAYAYQNNILNEETGEVTKRINDFGWIGPVYVNKVEVYRKEISSSNIIPDNTNWGSEDLYTTLTSFDPEVGIIKQIYQDDDASLAQGQVYIYRAQVYDTNDEVERTRLDPDYNSNSLQSEIYDEGNSFSFSSIVNGVFTFTDPDDLSDFSANAFVAITGTSSSDGFYRVEKLSGKEITLFDKTINDGSGNVSKAFGIVSLDL